MIDAVWQEKIAVHFSVRLKCWTVWQRCLAFWYQWTMCSEELCFLTKPLESLLIESLGCHEFDSFTEVDFSWQMLHRPWFKERAYQSENFSLPVDKALLGFTRSCCPVQQCVAMAERSSASLVQENQRCCRYSMPKSMEVSSRTVFS